MQNMKNRGVYIWLLAKYIVEDMRLLMVDEVRILNKKIIKEDMLMESLKHHLKKKQIFV